MNCVVPENIHTHPKEGEWKFQGGWGFKSPIFLKESMTLKMEFPEGVGFKLKITFRGRGMDIFWNNTLDINEVSSTRVSFGVC